MQGTDFFFQVNELTINDDMLTENPRKETYIQYQKRIEASAIQSTFYFEGEEYEHDLIHWFGLQVSQEGKSYTRSRRKFWDDVSTRGGQYSSAIIVLTALYYLF